MTRIRLLLRYARQVLVYGIQAAVLLTPFCLVAATIAAQQMKLKSDPMSLLPWVFLNILVLGGPVCGILMQRFWHPEERMLNANHGLDRLLLWPVAVLSLWLPAGLASLALQVRDGRIKPDTLMNQGSGMARNGLGWIQYWLKLYPWLPAAVGGGLLLILLVWVILALTARDERFEVGEDESWELAIDSATHAFGSRRVLKGAWMNCRSREIVGLLGRNGCGKSTLLQIAFGTLVADFRGLFINDHPVNRLYRLPGVIAYLPQTSFLPRGMRVAAAIRLFAGETAYERLAAEERLAPLLHTRVMQLSGGERRFLELGVILALDRPFVLLDEPFSELEPLYKIRAREWIREAAQRGSGIVVTDHDYSHILKLSDRLLLMQHGQTEEIHDEKELKRAYLPV